MVLFIEQYLLSTWKKIILIYDEIQIVFIKKKYVNENENIFLSKVKC